MFSLFSQSLCLPKGMAVFFLFSWANFSSFHLLIYSSSFLPSISFFIFEQQPYFAPFIELFPKVMRFLSIPKSFFLTCSSFPIHCYLLTCTSCHSRFFLPQAQTPSCCRPFPSSGFSSSLSTVWFFFSFSVPTPDREGVTDYMSSL